MRALKRSGLRIAWKQEGADQSLKQRALLNCIKGQLFLKKNEKGDKSKRASFSD